MLFVVTAEFRRGAAGDDITGEAAAELADLVGSDAGVVSAEVGHDSWSVTLDIEAPAATSAVRSAIELVTVSARQAGMPQWPAVRVEATRADVQAQR